MSSYHQITFSTEGRIGRLTLDRPAKLNALTPEMLTEILDALGKVARSDLSALVITGNGNGFCAGVDLKTSFFMEGVEEASAFEGKRLLDWQHAMIDAIYHLPQVTICAVNGDAVGGAGFGMAMACDIRFAVPRARFWMIPIKVDVVQDFGLTWFLQRAIGQPRTMELLMTGRSLEATQAEQWGVINAVYPPDELLPAAMKVADLIASAGRDAVLMSKQNVRHGAQVDLRTQLHHEAVANGLCFHSSEFEAKQRMFRQRALGRSKG